MTASVFNPGTLIVGVRNQMNREGKDTSGALASYEIKSADQLHRLALRHQFVTRPSGKTIAAEKYSAQMASNDFSPSKVATLNAMLDTLGPSKCSKAVGRRPADGTRYLKRLRPKIEELEQIAAHGGYQIAIQPI